MKKVIFYAIVLISKGSFAQEGKKFNDTSFLQPIEVQAVRAADKAPFAKTGLSKKDIEKNNTGQDLPFLLNQTPSVVANSDAGNGVGYTGIRIRGIDATRINVTLNGIPYNDAESQGTFFVDLPDISSSANSIQIQRGVGTSSNGSGAFGSSINLATNDVNDQPYYELNSSCGSFNTRKNNILFGSGILARHITIDGRASIIRSDGYIDRAASHLRSFYLSTAYVAAKTSLRLNIISGREKTYQAWNGVPEHLLDSLRTFNSAGTERPGTPYENETDNYVQTHYQLFYNRKFNACWKASLALFLTKGKGYYEQYKAGQYFSDYGLPDYDDGTSIVKSSDLVRRLWLDNAFYGTVFSLQYRKKQTQLTLGGSCNAYDGKHFGEIPWAVVQAAVPVDHRWYNLTAHKKEISFYGKWTNQWSARWQGFADIQFRNVPYTIHGFRYNPALTVIKNHSFFNPKLGITYTHKGWQAYASWAMAGKEPIRDDIEAGSAQQPKAEKLYDLEMGIEKKNGDHSFGAGIYYMKYRDQLVLTGKINDVGAYTRSNIPRSYRAGIELQGKACINRSLQFSGNICFSENKLKDFTEYLDDYDNGGQQTKYYSQTTISFSPAVTGSATVTMIPEKHCTIDLTGKYVSRQFLDNTSQRSRSLDPYFTQDIRFSCSPGIKCIRSTNIILQLNNVFNKKYEPNGYSFSYIYGGVSTTENFYFPMAGFNWMLGVKVRI